MLTIYKFYLKPILGTFDFYIELQQDAKILSIEVQYEKAVIYALVDTDKRKERRYGVSIPTGYNIPGYNIEGNDFLKEHEFIGTTMYNGGDTVQHVFLKK